MRIRYSSCVRACSLFVSSLMIAVSANGQNRFWVSGVGNDADPSTRTAPCKTFSGAMGRVAGQIEIDATDPGDFLPVTLDRHRLTDNATGMMVRDNSLVFVTGSSASNNTGSGFVAQSTFGGAAQLDIENSTTANNGNAGVVSQNPNAVATISNVTVDHNLGAGIVPLAGGQILTANNNKVNGNAGGPGTTTGVLTIM